MTKLYWIAFCFNSLIGGRRSCHLYFTLAGLSWLGIRYEHHLWFCQYKRGSTEKSRGSFLLGFRIKGKRLEFNVFVLCTLEIRREATSDTGAICLQEASVLLQAALYHNRSLNMLVLTLAAWVYEVGIIFIFFSHICAFTEDFWSWGTEKVQYWDFPLLLEGSRGWG